ncbi:MAG: tetratricopeptide repeat protein, partial [Nostoc sp.]|uniref:tetratricopeptide repeat protein n=1 Tax=Nostoc sp. TaxID=1180 RepID=UPI002FF5309A
FLNYRQGNHKLAIADFNQALQINPNLADAYGNRGLAEYALGDRKNAINDLEQAASLFQRQGDTLRYKQTQALLEQIQP